MLRARAVKPRDDETEERVLAFIKAEARGGLFVRPDPLLAQAIRSGLAIVIEDGDTPIAIALTFDYTGHRYHYFELGTHLVAKAYEGRGLQAALSFIQLAQSRLDPTDLDPSGVFAVMEKDSPSHHTAVTRARLKVGDLNDEMRALRDRRGVRPSLGKIVCFADRESYDTAFDALRTNTKDKVFKTHKGELILLDFPWLEALLRAGPYDDEEDGDE